MEFCSKELSGPPFVGKFTGWVFFSGLVLNGRTILSLGRQLFGLDLTTSRV